MQYYFSQKPEQIQTYDPIVQFTGNGKDFALSQSRNSGLSTNNGKFCFKKCKTSVIYNLSGIIPVYCIYIFIFNLE